VLGAKVETTGLGTDIRVEFFVPQFTQRIFIRMGCEIFDEGEQSLGKYVQDFSSGLPYRPINFVAQSFQRPVMHLPPISGADHASCRFAGENDPVPDVRAQEVEVELLTTHELHLINHSRYRILSVKFDCVSLDGKITTHFESAGLGLTPGYVAPRQQIPGGPVLSCAVTAVQVAGVGFGTVR
jgi:hypothetical protein